MELRGAQGVSSFWWFPNPQRRQVAFFSFLVVLTVSAEPTPVDFDRDIRPILSNNCFQCHGPDVKQQQANLRLDTAEGALSERESGTRAIVPGKPEQSEVIRRVASLHDDERMPPSHSGKKLSTREIGLLKKWIQQGAKFTEHWAYRSPTRPAIPTLNASHWPKNEIDCFILSELEQNGLSPSLEADRHALIRRLSIDLTGLPPPWVDSQNFTTNPSPVALERLVDRLCSRPTFGEHWARMWLDLARYADSAGYADDPPRTIWAYRDWVIRAINANMAFDQFTIEQFAGDLLPNPNEDQLIATAFHRNTLTNNEGGTNDEEFRNVAIVDRVNTTMQVWMGTTIRCAQCHNHKYDPLSQQEFFELFAILNNTADADLFDESPLLTVMTNEIKQKETELERQLITLEKQLLPDDESFIDKHREWKELAHRDYKWKTLVPTSAKSTGKATLTISEDGDVLVSGAQPKKDTYFLEIETELSGITALQIEAVADNSLPSKGPGRAENGNFVLTEFRVADNSESRRKRMGRFVRIDLPGKDKVIHIAEVEVRSGGKNIARDGKATQSSTHLGGFAKHATDGNTDGVYTNHSVTHTTTENDPWWEVDLGLLQPIDSVSIWNRTDGDLASRLNGLILSILDDNHSVIWKETYQIAPQPKLTADLTGAVPLVFTDASADAEQIGPNNHLVLNRWAAKRAIDDNGQDSQTGWAVGGFAGNTSRAAFQLKESVGIEGELTRLQFTLEQQYGDQHTLGHFRISATTAVGAVKLVPPAIAEVLNYPWGDLDNNDKQKLVDYYMKTLVPPKPLANEIIALQKRLDDIKPTTVPIMRELPPDQHRQTHVQHRGNFLDVGQKVSAGIPAVFHELPPNAPFPMNRLTLAKWLIDDRNPLTARVVVNRYWEAIFGVGLVRTSEEFGAQGERPSHPRLLDYLATELMRRNWDTRALLRLIVQSAAYRQSAAVTAEQYERFPDNQLVSRGPRFRVSAEVIRDQALFVSGLLEKKLYGPPVRPPQPKLGLLAAFGPTIDWEPSQGSDRYRRAVYTTWRRSSPYPSMATFDAPNREVCTIRRSRTNTPLQALVTLNDPVYVEAAQGLARRIAAVEGSLRDQAQHGFRLCLSRNPSSKELDHLVELYQQSHLQLKDDADKASQLATVPLGPLPPGADPVRLAAWTVVGNVLLNLDEMFLKK